MSRRRKKESGALGCLSLFLLLGLIGAVIDALESFAKSARGFFSNIPSYLNRFFEAICEFLENSYKQGSLFFFTVPILLCLVILLVIKHRAEAKKNDYPFERLDYDTSTESRYIYSDSEQMDYLTPAKARYEYTDADYPSLNRKRKKFKPEPYIQLFDNLVIDNNASHYTDKAEKKAYDLLLEANKNYAISKSANDFPVFLVYYEATLTCLSQASYIEQRSQNHFSHIQGSIDNCYCILKNGMIPQIKLALMKEYESVSKIQDTKSEESKSEIAKRYHALKVCIDSKDSYFDKDSLSSANQILTLLAKKGGIHHDASSLRKNSHGVFEFDNISGIEFESFCVDLLYNNGFTNIVGTKGSGDQGVDIIAEKDHLRYAIQCKCYSSNLGNTPIQEVCAGKVYYKCQIGVVMTNRYFTKAAQELATATGTLLWDRDKIIEMNTY